MSKRNQTRPQPLAEDQLDAISGGSLNYATPKFLLPAVKPANPLAPRGIIIVGG